MYRWLKPLALITVIGMYVVLVAGNLVTNTDSAQGCGNSWPLCNGVVVPIFRYHTIIEFSHRLVSGVEGILVFVSAIWMWRRFKRPDVRVLAPCALLFLMTQVFLGAGAVVFHEPPLLLAAHLGVSFSAFGSVLLLYVIAAQGGASAPRDVKPGLRRLVWFSVVATYVLVFTGAYVRHTAAGLACGRSWPGCNGDLLPSLSGLAGVQMLHRLSAFVVVVIVAYMAHQLWHRSDGRSDLRAGALWAIGLIVLQALLGGLSVMTALGLTEVLAHSGVAAAFFGVLLYLAYQVAPSAWRGERRAESA